jgi:putative ABC transport system permease protein
LTAGRNTRQDTNSLYVVLKPGMSAAFVEALKKDRRLKLDALTGREYYDLQTEVVDQLRSLGLIVGLALEIGATLGGMNTMYTAVARREREIGVLRVLGISRANILAALASRACSWASGAVWQA